VESAERGVSSSRVAVDSGSGGWESARVLDRIVAPVSLKVASLPPAAVRAR
ncbi:hypothetical protein OY671_011785, partial [Metschnikowia pulcherrima]